MRVRAALRTWVGLGLGMLAMMPSFELAHASPDKKTERTWRAKCASCHGQDGRGQTEQAKKMGGVPDLTAREWQEKHDDDVIRKQILEGVKREENGIVKEMKPFKDELAPDQVDALIAYVRQLAPKT